MEDDTPLSLATDAQIVDELERRSKALLLVTVRDAPKVGQNDDILVSWRGGVYTAIGLAEKFKHTMLNATGNQLFQPKGREP